MASCGSPSWVCSVAVLLHVAAWSISMATASSTSTRCYKKIYSFGDSTADTGSYYYYDTDIPPSQSLVLNPPYGETYFHHPTGRWSDGRLVIDFFAEHMGIPLLKPYLGIKNGKLQDWKPREGVNFAVGGATALDSSFFIEKGIYNCPTNYSLGVQLDWFKQLLPSICNSSSVLLHVAAWSISIATASSTSARCYKTIYSFGDSIADIGSYYYDDTDILTSQSLVLNPPYGETYFHYPTGRWSDDRLVIDFFAEHMGIPPLKPYLGIKDGKIRDWNPREGVNFAVGGATALDPSFFVDKGIYNISTNYSPGVQLDWFKQLLPSICNSSSDCKEVLANALFLVGEIGGNDFNHPLVLYKSVEEIRTYIPHVINEISSAINKLIDLGAQTLVVPGNFPLGCNFIYLTIYQSTDMEEYDQAGCLNWLNKFADYYNKQLYAELNRLQVLHPSINIIYADYYHAALRLYQSPRQFGFKESILNACCPAGDPTNFNASISKRCGNPGVIACDDPSQYISWDGVHLTEAAYKWVAEGLLNGLYTYPKIGISCDSEI